MFKTKKQTREVEVEIVEVFICDKCKKEITPQDTWEWDEAYSISFRGGYASVFGDGAEVECDLCQHCLKELIETYCRVKDEYYLGGGI
jgi:hypothetical protein